MQTEDKHIQNRSNGKQLLILDVPSVYKTAEEQERVLRLFKIFIDIDKRLKKAK